MSIVSPQLRCSESGILQFESRHDIPIAGPRSREGWLELAAEFLPITTEDMGDVTNVSVNLRDENFLDQVEERPGIPFAIGLLAKATDTLMTHETPDGVDPVIKLKRFDDESVIAGVYHQFQNYLCSGKFDAEAAKSVIDMMSLVHGRELNKHARDEFEVGDNFYRGRFFQVTISDQKFNADEDGEQFTLKWPTLHLDTLGDSTTFGYVSRPNLEINSATKDGTEELYTQLFSNVYHSLHALSLVLGIARVADLAANYSADTDIFS